MTPREHFFRVLKGEPVDRAPFFPDITTWYQASRLGVGAEQPYFPGQFIPEDSPLHALPSRSSGRGGPRGARLAELSFVDLYREFGWGLPAHMYDWFEERYTGGVEKLVTTEGRHRTVTWRTPRGDLVRTYKLDAEGSWSEYGHLVKDLAQLDIVRRIVENTTLRAALRAGGALSAGDQGLRGLRHRAVPLPLRQAHPRVPGLRGGGLRPVRPRAGRPGLPGLSGAPRPGLHRAGRPRPGQHRHPLGPCGREPDRPAVVPPLLHPLLPEGLRPCCTGPANTSPPTWTATSAASCPSSGKPVSTCWTAAPRRPCSTTRSRSWPPPWPGGACAATAACRRGC